MDDKKLSSYNSKGEEIPDSTPVALPVGYERPIPLGERIRSLIRSEALKREVEAAGAETFDEADDFEIPDDDTFDRATPYEDRFEPEVPGISAREQELRAGFVEDIPYERKKKARETIEKHLKKEPKQAPKNPSEDDK